MPGPLACVFLARPRTRNPKGHMLPTSGEDCSYLTNLTDEALEKDSSSLAYYTRCAYVILTTGRAGHWDAFLSDKHRKEKHVLEESICNLALKRDTYPHKVQKANVSLTRISDALSAFNLPDSLVGQVTLLARDIKEG